ncbi:MAG TPA: pseudouridine synthase [Opitutaceae bacterium]
MRRIDQLLASLGYGSRRQIRDWMDAGRITVRGVRERDPGLRVEASDVLIDGDPPDHPEELLLLLNKPVGRVCSHNAAEGPSVYDLLPPRWQRRNPPVSSVGRLDKDTSGLLLLTDCSALVHRLTSPKHKVAKVYRARLDRDLPPGVEALFSSGSYLLPGEKTPCAPAGLRRISGREAEITLTEGRYHQVKRMFGTQGCVVTELHRISFGHIDLGNLEPGKWIELPINSFDTPEGS